jgi:hypothetical protein
VLWKHKEEVKNKFKKWKGSQGYALQSIQRSALLDWLVWCQGCHSHGLCKNVVWERSLEGPKDTMHWFSKWVTKWGELKSLFHTSNCLGIKFFLNWYIFHFTLSSNNLYSCLKTICDILDLIKVLYFFYFLIHLFTCAYIVWAISPPTLCPLFLLPTPPRFQAKPVSPYL